MTRERKRALTRMGTARSLTCGGVRWREVRLGAVAHMSGRVCGPLSTRCYSPEADDLEAVTAMSGVIR